MSTRSATLYCWCANRTPTTVSVSELVSPKPIAERRLLALALLSCPAFFASLRLCSSRHTTAAAAAQKRPHERYAATGASALRLTHA